MALAADDLAARMRSSWERNAAAWTDAVRERRIASRRAGTDAAIVAAVLRSQPESVLDVGCGEGWLARELSARGCRVSGIDASEALIVSARNLGGGTFVAMTYAGIAARADALGAPFDVVVCNFSLLEEDLSAELRALRSVLAADGLLLIQTVHPWTANRDAQYV
ncbi:MAG TPA: class I SAM-dependent methyltransferase, partial [Rhodanobacteraceae bacterium]|nr:class I SAM-dependent methyltransferase [Rhodanobacteraceae bacterium]